MTGKNNIMMKRLAVESITNFRIVLFITIKNGLKAFNKRITVLRYVQLGKDRLDYSRDEWYRTIALILDDTLTNECNRTPKERSSNRKTRPPDNL